MQADKPVEYLNQFQWHLWIHKDSTNFTWIGALQLFLSSQKCDNAYIISYYIYYDGKAVAMHKCWQGIFLSFIIFKRSKSIVFFITIWVCVSQLIISPNSRWFKHGIDIHRCRTNAWHHIWADNTGYREIPCARNDKSACVSIFCLLD